MCIKDAGRTRQYTLLRSTNVRTITAFCACTPIALALADRSLAATTATVLLASAPDLPISANITHQWLMFMLLLVGFIVMAGGCFILSRRSLRDVLNAEDKRTEHM